MYTSGHNLSLHDALPISGPVVTRRQAVGASDACGASWMCLPLCPLRSEHRLACVGRKRPDKVRKTISFEFARQGHQVNMRRIRRPNLDRQVEGGDDGEITLAAKPFASKCAHILPDGKIGRATCRERVWQYV